MPTYTWFCDACAEEIIDFCKMEERNEHIPNCTNCHCGDDVRRVPDAPNVMNVAMADGTRRFDNVRKFQALKKAQKAEKDKAHKKRMQRDMDKLTGRSA